MLATATTCCKTSMAGPLLGAIGRSGSGHHLAKEDINGGPPVGCCRWV
jgi:hypothetical protein